MIPGLGATCRSWDPIAPDLAQHFSLILPDNRDVGKSVGKRKPRSLGDFAADLVDLLDRLQIERTHVVGISLGGVIAQQFAIDHPSRLNRLVLISTAHRFGPYLRDITGLLGRCLYRMPYARFQRTIELLGTAPAYYDEYIQDIEQKIELVRHDHAPRGAVATQLRCLAVSEVGPTDYRIVSPTLVLAGEYDAMVPNCYAKKMADDIPGSEFRILAGCGHNPVTERPEEALPLIIEFLNRSDPEGLASSSFFEKSGNRFRDEMQEVT
jgi:3-oxoadipate enol-lactonase